MVKTFDGEHPCSLCKSIAKSQQHEKQQQIRVRVLKVDMLHEITALAMIPPTGEVMKEIASVSYSERAVEPAVPPPRFAA